MDTERLAARGPKGEACVVIRTRTRQTLGPEAPADDAAVELSYKLASGERLRTTDQSALLETLDGKRQFRLL